MIEEHWAADEAARKRLAVFGNQHGLSGEGVLEILDVEKLSEYTGTEKEAIATIMAWVTLNEPPEPEPAPAYEPVEVTADEMARYEEAVKGLASTPIWLRVDGRGYYEVSVQSWLPPELTRVGLVYARQALEDYQAIFGDLVATGGNGAQRAAPALSLVPPSGNGNQDLTFTATKLVGSMMGGKTYWNVIGPRFPQYGVRIWPEILKESGIDESKLDPSQEYPLDGYTATYVEKEKDDKTVPDKVVSLTKVA